MLELAKRETDPYHSGNADMGVNVGILDDIAEAADALTDPRPHAEPRHGWDANRHKVTLTPHRTIIPGLIQQLRDTAEPGAGGDDTGGQVPGSRPPVSLDAVSLIAAISYGAAWRCQQLGVTGRATPEEQIRALVGEAARLPFEDAEHPHLPSQRNLCRELRSWRHQAEIVTGWQTPPVELIAPCPIVDVNGTGRPCAARGSLLAYADGTGARCVACGARWDEATVSVLFDHARRYKTQADAKAAEVRRQVREVKDQARQQEVEARNRRCAA